MANFEVVTIIDGEGFQVGEEGCRNYVRFIQRIYTLSFMYACGFDINVM